MAELNTKPSSRDVSAFLDALDESQRGDCKLLISMMERVTGDTAVMWGTNVIGFGIRHLKYDSGRELDWMKIGFAPRKGKIVIYSPNYLDDYKDDLQKIGKYKTGKGCLYINRLSDVDLQALENFLHKMEKIAAAR